MRGPGHRFGIGWAVVVMIGLALPAEARLERNPFSVWYLADAESWWYADLVLGVGVEPDYPGSDDVDAELGGLVRLTFLDPWSNRYALSLDTVSATFDLGESWNLQLALEIEDPRENDNPALEGFEERDTTLEGEVTLSHRWGDGFVYGKFQPDLLGRGKGLVYFVGGGVDLDPTDWLRLALTLDLSLADGEHMRTEFGISERDAEASGLPRYRPSGGLKSVTAGLVAEATVWGPFGVFAGGELEYYFPEASDSPLIDRFGSEITGEALVGVRFHY